jgi:hypothetical protein
MAAKALRMSTGILSNAAASSFKLQHDQLAAARSSEATHLLIEKPDLSPLDFRESSVKRQFHTPNTWFKIASRVVQMHQVKSTSFATGLFNGTVSTIGGYAGSIRDC